MKFSVHPDFNNWINSIHEAEKTMDRVNTIKQELKMKREARKQKKSELTFTEREEMATKIFNWFNNAVDAGVFKQMFGVMRDDIKIWAPITEDGRTGMGRYFVGFRLDKQPCFFLNHRKGPFYGDGHTFSSSQELAENIPPAILKVMVSDIETGEIWTRIKWALDERMDDLDKQLRPL